MFEKLEITRMAQALAAHAGARLGVIAGNVANADTPGFKAQDLPDFGTIYQADGPMRVSRPGHIGGPGLADQPILRTITGSAAPNGNSVSLEAEMVKAAEVRQQHDMALVIYRSMSELMRTSLGRGR